jgi:hypothetical protein
MMRVRETRGVTLRLESPGRWRHPDGPLLVRHRSGRWHLALEIPHDCLRERGLYTSHPRWHWWRRAKATGPGLGDNAGRGIGFDELAQQITWACARDPYPPIEIGRIAA